MLCFVDLAFIWKLYAVHVLIISPGCKLLHSFVMVKCLQYSMALVLCLLLVVKERKMPKYNVVKDAQIRKKGFS